MTAGEVTGQAGGRATWTRHLPRTMADSDLRHDANLFTIARWILSSAVLFSHSFELTAVSADPSRAIMPFPISRLAVLLFFSLSGFLVTGSLVKRGVAQFAIARALRLLPGMLVMLAVTALIASAAFSTAPFVATLTNGETLRYLGRNAALLGDAYSMPHVFAANPVATVVNGSLWTIRHEVRCYAALALLGAAGLLSFRTGLLALFVVGIAVHLVVPLDIVPALREPRILAISFFFGTLLYLWRHQLRLSWPLGVVLVGGTLLLPASEPARVALALAAAYLLFVAAIRVPTAWHRVSAAVPDYSYGIYIYAYPIQQAVFAAGIGRTPLANFIASLAITIVAAGASWHFVEKPALALKRHWERRRALKV